MMDYSFDIYLEFVPMLYATTSPSEYYEWEDAIIHCYSIGELPLNQLAKIWLNKASLFLCHYGSEECRWNMLMTIALLGTNDGGLTATICSSS